MKIGLTGGIASGKSAASDRFASLGVPVIDADILAREAVMPDTPGLAAIVAHFGQRALTAGGDLDREAMRRLIFNDRSARRKLEGIVHPFVVDELKSRSDIALEDAPYCILAVPLLIEVNLHKEVDRVLVIDVLPETQRERLSKRDGSKPAQIEKILAAQLGRKTRLRFADDVIDNNGTLAQLTEQIDRLHDKYRALSGKLVE